jgi:hypothetical protein
MGKGKNKSKTTSADTTNPMMNDGVPSAMAAVPDGPKGVGSDGVNINDYSYCMVFGCDPKTNLPTSPSKYNALKKLSRKGLDLYAYQSFCKSKIIVLIRIPLGKMRKYAEEKAQSMLLNPEKLKETAEAGDAERNIGKIVLEQGGADNYLPYEYIYAPYRDESEAIFEHGEGEEHPFTELTRNQLCKMMIEERPDDGSEPFKIRRYLKSGDIKAFFPLHAPQPVLGQMESKWLTCGRFTDYIAEPPFHMIRNYFGEKLAFLFLFESHYGQYLIWPAALGIPFQVAVLVTNNYSLDGLPALAFFIAMWAVTMTEFWKRKECRMALEWGVMNAEEQEPNRPDYKGHKQKSPVTGEDEIVYPVLRQAVNISVSIVTVFTLACLAIGVVVGIYLMRRSLREDLGPEVQYLASLLNALQIQFFDALFNTWLAYVLTDFENHRTDTMYSDSILSKLFAFQFVNAYSSFFYVAFVAPYVPKPVGADDDAIGECGYITCMPSLATNLAIIFGSRLASAALSKSLMPWLSKRFTGPVEDDPESELDEALVAKMRTEPELQMELAPYDPMIVNIQSYMELALQFGYVALFVTALPIAPLFAFVSVMYDLRASASQLLHQFQRPQPAKAEDIGAWQNIFEIIAMAAVVTNAGIMIFTMDTFDGLDTTTRMFLFIGFQWLCISLQMLIGSVVPDMPAAVKVQIGRTDFLVNKLIEHVPDQDQLGDDAGIVPEIHAYPF